jgi:hypothetical protein
MDSTVISTVAGCAVGGIITWIVAYKYYKKASRELLNEAAQLRSLNILMIRAMENAGLARFNRDEQGKPIGLQITLSGKMVGESETSEPELKIE